VPGFDWIWWLPWTAALSAVGLVAAWRSWRRSDRAATVRRLGWALAPWSVLLLGLYGLVWRIGSAAAGWVTRFGFDPTAWLGVGTGLIATTLILLGRRLGRRAVDSRPPPREVAQSREPAGDEFAEIEALLRKRGIH